MKEPTSASLALYETFQKKKPRRVRRLPSKVRIAEKLGSSGRVRRILYRSGKWRLDRKQELYVHTYESPVAFAVPWRHGLSKVPSIKAREFVQLGECAELEVVQRDGAKRVDVYPRHTRLCATPDGKSLVLIHLDLGFLGAITGGRQRITDRGIEG